MNGIRAVLGAVLVTAASSAVAQDVGAIGSQVDFSIARQDDLTRARTSPRRAPATDNAFLSGETPVSAVAPPPPFTLTMGIPFTTSSNATRAADDPTARAHSVPFVRLDYARSTGRFGFGARAGMQHDEFIEFAPSDQTAVFGRFAVNLDKSTETLSPYISYSPLIVYTDFLRNHFVTFHDLAIGVQRRLPFRGGAVDVDVSYVRREASLAAGEQHRPTARVRYTRPLRGQAEWSVEQTVQPRFYTAGSNDGRSDLNATTRFVINWDPPRVRPIRISGSLSLEWNDSDRDTSDYTLVDFGPSVSASWRF